MYIFCENSCHQKLSLRHKLIMTDDTSTQSLLTLKLSMARVNALVILSGTIVIFRSYITHAWNFVKIFRFSFQLNHKIALKEPVNIFLQELEH